MQSDQSTVFISLYVCSAVRARSHHWKDVSSVARENQTQWFTKCCFSHFIHSEPTIGSSPKMSWRGDFADETLWKQSQEMSLLHKKEIQWKLTVSPRGGGMKIYDSYASFNYVYRHDGGCTHVFHKMFGVFFSNLRLFIESCFYLVLVWFYVISFGLQNRYIGAEETRADSWIMSVTENGSFSLLNWEKSRQRMPNYNH